MPTRALDDNDAQLLGHIKSFKKVIYTNGLNWKFFYGNEKCFDILRSVFFITLLFAFKTNQNMFRYEKEIILVDHHLRGKQEASLVQCDIHESYDSFQTNCDHDI